MAPPSMEEDSNSNTAADTNHKRRKLVDDSSDDDNVKKETVVVFPEVQQLLSLRKTPCPVPDLTAMTKLDLPGCQLSSLPSSLPEALPNLSILFLSNNQFTEVPAVIGRCPKLQMVAFKANALTSIHPDALQPQLRWLILTDNRLTRLPDTIGRCTRLQKFMLSGNALTELPDSVARCTNLELVRLSCNQLEKPPMKLLELPNLSWVAMSGNPFLKNVKLAAEAKQFKLRVLDDIPEGTGDILGQGAGGITRKVIWKDGQPVAVKTFCGAMTSDGCPEAERQMSLTVSTKIPDHDHLIELFGETPSGALVMEYLDQYQALAGPPDMETCSRDVYPADRDNKHYMTEAQAISMVTGLLCVLTQLHAHGICHGDFYAHNILVSDRDRYKVKLSDFGAAFFYDAEADYGKPLERTELRAFSHLVDEVREHFVEEKRSLLQDLAASCREATATFAKVNEYWKENCK